MNDNKEGFTEKEFESLQTKLYGEDSKHKITAEKTLELKEGQLIKNLTYTVNGDTKTITGVLKLIFWRHRQKKI